MNQTPSVLFVCLHNRCRSRAAEALARRRHPQGRFASAGASPALEPDEGARRALARRGIELSGPGRALSDVGEAFDWIVTLCDEGLCPAPAASLGARRLHRPVADPSARTYATPQAREAAYEAMLQEIEALLAEIGL